MKKFGLLLTTIVLFLGSVLAQTVTITGKVVDEKGAPIENASVQVKGAKVGMITGKDGVFSLKVPQNAKTLIISSVSFGKQEVAISNKPITVTLKPEDTSLDEVVVVGYGAAKKKTELVGQAVVVSGKDIQDRPTANILDALQGRVAGLQIFSSNGEPSNTPSARINGVGSLSGGTTPLYILDGIPVSAGSLVSLNPEDYESVTVLTDAASTSIYGARAANGVIVLNSKKGSSSKAKINITTQLSQSNLTRNTQDMYNMMMNADELARFWVATGYRSQAQVDALRAANPFDTRWDEVYYLRNRPTEQFDVSISGGSNKTTYYVSGGYFFQKGLAYRSDFKRYTFRSNVSTQVNNWAKLGVNLTGAYDTRQTNPYGTNSTNRGIALLAPPFYSPKDPATGLNYQQIPGWTRFHPEYLANNIRSNSENVQFTPSAFIEISPLKNLVIRSQAGMEAYVFTTSNQTLPSYIGSPGNGSASEGYTREVTRTINNTVEYKFTIKDDHSVGFLAGNEFIDNRDQSFSASSTGQTDDRLLLVTAGPSNRNVGAGFSAFAFTSFFGKVSYGFKNKFLLDGTVRQDKSSRFGVDNRTANFYSVGAVWKLKNEKFLDNVRWINDLNLKVSTGTSGNSGGSGTSLDDFTSQGLVGTNIFGAQAGLGISTAGNSGLAWEQQQSTNVSVNGQFFKKLNVQLEYYSRLTTSMLVDVPFPQTSGFSNIIGNVGSMSNKGVNVTISADFKGKNGTYFAPYVNFNYNKNEIVELFQDRDYWIQQGTGVLWAVGQPVSFVYPIFKGINPTNGDPEWFLPDPNPNNVAKTVTDPNSVTSTFDAVRLQQNTGIARFAPWSGGFGFQAGYKGFFTQWDFSFVAGKYMINNDRFFYENPLAFAGFNMSRTVNNYWQKPGDVTQFPRLGVTGGRFTQFDSRLVEDASFIRAKNITFGYNIPKSILDKTKFITGCKFFVTGRNLITLTKYQGPDPEVDSNVGLGTNPNTRQVSVGLDINF